MSGLLSGPTDGPSSSSTAGAPLHVLIVDDEPLARSRLRQLLAQITSPAVHIVGEAGNAVEAMSALHHATALPVDCVLLDIHMPGVDGLALAQAMRRREPAPAIVFVTAHAEHAVIAFELEATDYLTKPVRLERLQAALQKAERAKAAEPGLAGGSTPENLLIQDRGRAERVPLTEVLYFKAELKYVTVRTAARSYILDGALNDIEARHPGRFLRIHRNALVARHALRAIERHDDVDEGEGWAVRLDGVDEVLMVSRRQLAAVRDALAR